ncbi:MAG: calcium/sodium antiporter, partial [Bacteroidales bacterium]
SKLVIGVTLVSFGTSAPELFVSVIAAIQKQPEISIGNVIGSNIANIALVLAATSIIFSMPVKPNTVKHDWPVMMIASLLFYVFILNGFLKFWEGLLFITLLIAYLFFSLYYSRRNYDFESEKKIQAHFSLAKSILIIFLSSAGLAIGSYLLVNNAAKIAGMLGIEKRVISISVIAFGTSVPEIATSMIAAFKKEMDISIGNIIGSNIFNILGVLGIASIITPISIVEEMGLKLDILWMLGISVLLFLFILPVKGGKLTRIKGIVLFAIYCFYIYWLFLKTPGK